MDLISEFERLTILFYLTLGLSLVVYVMSLALVVWFAWKMRGSNELLRRYPLRTRLRAAFGRRGTWERLLQPEHIPMLQQRRAKVRRMLSIFLAGMLLHAGLRMGNRAVLERIEGVAEEARSRTYENVCP